MTLSSPEPAPLADLIAAAKRDDWTGFRALSPHHGIYPQRQNGLYLVRVRTLLGMISAQQLRTLADVAERFAGRELHFTMRQSIEIHDVPLDHLASLAETIEKVGLTPHESGGNTVRGIVTCPYAGVALDEPFDVTAHAVLVWKYFLHHPDFQNLPRKVKIGFSGATDDGGRTRFHDFGFEARLEQGKPGFRVWAGGGGSAVPRVGELFFDFIPVEDLIATADGLMRAFNRLGERTNRQRARVRHLIERIGMNAFRNEVETEIGLFKSRPTQPDLEPFQVEILNKTDASHKSCHQEIEKVLQKIEQQGAAAVYLPQAQGGLVTALLKTPGGWWSPQRLHAIADLIERFDLRVRVTPEQGLLLRGVCVEHLETLNRELRTLGLSMKSPWLSRLVACPGTAKCRSAAANTRALAESIATGTSGAEHSSAFPAVRISGCPHGCALHLVAEIGLEGTVLRDGAEVKPAFKVRVGGSDRGDETRMGAMVETIPATAVETWLEQAVEYYRRERHPKESFADFVTRVGVETFKGLLK